MTDKMYVTKKSFVQDTIEKLGVAPRDFISCLSQANPDEINPWEGIVLGCVTIFFVLIDVAIVRVVSVCGI